jgi:hypothetical protein
MVLSSDRPFTKLGLRPFLHLTALLHPLFFKGNKAFRYAETNHPSDIPTTMQGKFLRSYRKLSKNGQPLTVFVYTVAGTDAELEQFKASQGVNYRESDSAEPLWFTTKVAGQAPKLLFTSKGAVVADMSAFDQAHSLASQYGGSLGQELARQASAMLMTGAMAPASAPVVPPVAKTDDADLTGK